MTSWTGYLNILTEEKSNKTIETKGKSIRTINKLSWWNGVDLRSEKCFFEISEKIYKSRNHKINFSVQTVGEWSINIQNDFPDCFIAKPKNDNCNISRIYRLKCEKSLAVYTEQRERIFFKDKKQIYC